MRTDEYAEKGTLTHTFGGYPNTLPPETMAIIGYGSLGQRIAALTRVLGMKVVVAERKGQSSVREDRTAFETCLRDATVVVVTATKSAETINMIADSEFATMRRDAILINVARGGIVNERDLVAALRQGAIAGAAVDVFEVEPPIRGLSPLLDETNPNLTLSAHLAWFSVETVQNLQDLVVWDFKATLKASRSTSFRRIKLWTPDLVLI